MIYLIQKYWLYITVIIAVSISTLSLWPVAHLPSVPGTDKTHHFISYGALMLPAALRQPKYLLVIVFIFLTFSGLNMAANALGLVCGFIIAKIILFFTINKECC